MIIHWGSFALGVGCTPLCIPVAYFLWWAYNLCCTDHETGRSPRWLRRDRWR
jgi:hypothetical protein